MGLPVNLEAGTQAGAPCEALQVTSGEAVERTNAMPRSGEALCPGAWLGDGRYQICSIIAEGSTCTVYRARHARLGREVAIKVFSRDFIASPLAFALIESEVAAASAAQHPNLVQILDRDEHEGVPFLVMELLPGETLLDRLLRNGPLSPREALAITKDVLAGLGEAHARGVVHRDVKPQNIVLTSTVNGEGQAIERAKLCDFGIATWIGESDASVSPEHGSSICGTPEYMAPEQAQAQPVDARTDVYSLGITLFQMLTGQVPFQADSPLATTALQVEKPLPAPSQLNPEICAAAEALIVRATRKIPARRFASAAEMSLAVDRLLRSEWAAGPRELLSLAKASPPKARRRRGFGRRGAQPAWVKANTLRLRRLPDRATKAVAAMAMLGFGALALHGRDAEASLPQGVEGLDGRPVAGLQQTRAEDPFVAEVEADAVFPRVPLLLDRGQRLLEVGESSLARGGASLQRGADAVLSHMKEALADTQVWTQSSEQGHETDER